MMEIHFAVGFVSRGQEWVDKELTAENTVKPIKYRTLLHGRRMLNVCRSALDS